MGDEDRDGGESGSFFDHSAYSRIIEDVENGKIGVCIMKDMTRWGRDYLQVGNAMEKRGIRTVRGDLNRKIKVTNQKLRQLKALSPNCKTG